MSKKNNYENILKKLEELLDKEHISSMMKLKDPYWSSENTNVGQDELTAINLMKTLNYEYSENLNINSFFYNLINDIVNLKKTYDLIYEDFDGYGTATFNSVINDLIDHTKNLDVKLSNNPLDAYLKDRKIHYTLDERINLSLSFIKLLIYEHKYSYTLDFIQINLFLLSLKLYKSLDEISDTEIIFFTKRFYFIRTILIQILIEMEPFTPSSVKVSIYSYIGSCSNILDFIKSSSSYSSSFKEKNIDKTFLGIENTSPIWQDAVNEFMDDIEFVKGKSAHDMSNRGKLKDHIELVNERYFHARYAALSSSTNTNFTLNQSILLPFTTFALSHDKASNISDDEDRIDFIGFQLLFSIEDMSDKNFINFIYEMFEKTLFIDEGLKNSTFINYMIFDNYSFRDSKVSLDWEESKVFYIEELKNLKPKELEKRKEVVRFIIKNVDTNITVNINRLGSYEDISYLTESLINQANHLISFNSNGIKNELMDNLSKLSKILLVDYYGNRDIFKISARLENDSYVDKLIFISEEILSLIPFSALIDDNLHHLVENFEILNVKSLKSFSNHKHFSRDDFKNGAIIANPDFSYNSIEKKDLITNIFSSLPYSEQEASVLADKYQWGVYTKEAASKKAFISSLAKVSILHIASHGIFQGDILQKKFQNIKDFSDSFNQIQMKSAIVFAGANHKSFQNLGYMTVADIYKLTNVNTELVYLSLCVGGMGTIIEGETSLSISKALLQSGVKTVIASLFQVEDKMAQEIAISFYKELYDGYSIEYSLRQAQLKLLKRNELFPIWAGFQILL